MMKANEYHRTTILMVGPIKCSGGISAVINSILKQKISHKYNIVRIDTSIHKDGGVVGELKTVLRGLSKYLYYLIFKKVDIIHIHTSAYISFYRKSIFGLIGGIFHKKLVYHIHASRFYDFFYSPSNRILEKYIYNTFRSADRIVCLCSDWKKCLEEKYRLSNIVVIWNPVAIVPITKVKVDLKEVTRLLFVGFYLESKGIKDLLEVCRELYIKGIKYELYICGKGDLGNYINHFIGRYSLSRCIRNIGWVSGEGKERMFNDADILILPSYKEGMPVVILEAFSYGLPVISTNVSGIPEIVKDNINGFLVKPGDQIDLFNRISTLINNPDLRRKMCRNNLDDVKKHAPQKIAEQWEYLYEELLSE